MSDRLDRAHALRAAIHGWLKEHPYAGMAAIVAAFAAVPDATVRKSVQTLGGLGSVQRHGASNTTTYTALGEEIYRADSMRKKMRTGHANLLHDYNRDRLAQAWKLRNAIHGFVTANPRSRMSIIVAAFPATPAATVRKHVKALCKLQNLVMHGESIGARYFAATAEIYEVETVREKLRSNGRAVGALQTSEKPIDDAPAASPRGLCQAKSSKYTNSPCHLRPIRNPDAMGSGGVRCGGYSMLATVF